MFVGREKELSRLEEEYKRHDSSLVVIYGRRRVGKTALIQKSLEGRKNLYLYVPNQSGASLLPFFSETMKRIDPNPTLSGFPSFREFLEYLAARYSGSVIVLDEFQRIEAIRGASSVLQNFWDENKANKNLKIVLSGSSIGMTKKIALSESSPLFGRRTLEMKLPPLGFLDVQKWFKTPFNETLGIYSAFGGTPAYLEKYDAGKSLYENIEHSVLRTGEPLYNEAEHILTSETRKPAVYLSILKAVSTGHSKLGQIASAIGLNVNKTTFYMSVLENDLDIIRKDVPITENNLKSRGGIYRITDNYFSFWARYVLAYRRELESGNASDVLARIKAEHEQLVGKILEDAAAELLAEANKRGALPLRFSRIGKWWHKEEEIDIVAVNDSTKEILFCEAKYRNKQVCKKDIEGLREKAKAVKWNNGDRKEHYMFISKSGFAKNVDEEPDCTLLNIEGLLALGGGK